MFLDFTRATNKDGIFFYSKDIMLNKYTHSNDIKIKINCDYNNNGIGVVLIDKTTPEQNIFLFKFSNYNFEIIKKDYITQQKMYKVSHEYKAPISNFIFYLHKIGNKVLIYDSKDKIIAEYDLPIDMQQYSFGIYSNKGNKLNNITVVSGVPNKWITNINNTNGGRIEFVKNGFIIEGCNNNAEIEQSKIKLPKGKYFVKFNKKNINNIFDIIPYIYYSKDKELFSKDKNILKKDNNSNYYFKLDKDEYVNIRFEGMHGKVSNIAIIDNINDTFVPTYDIIKNRKGGYLTIFNNNDVSKIVINAVIKSRLINNKTANILLAKDDQYLYYYQLANLKLNNEYKYVINFDNNTFSILDNNNNNLTRQEMAITAKASKIIANSSFKMFCNINTIITDFSVYKTNGTIEKPLIQKTKKYYVPGDIKSPIIATENNMPLDLSSSYRVITKNNNKLYKFTNWEREVFYNTNILELEKKPYVSNNTVLIFGIPSNSHINKSALYSVDKNINDISRYADIYDIIPFNYKYYLPYANVLKLPDELQYEQYVIDYLKSDSYCINCNYDEKTYEVDISCNHKNIDIYYDYSDTIIYNNPGIVNKYISLSKVR